MLSTACSTALDPMRFDGARYGMPESDLALQLHAVSSPEMRFFPAGDFITQEAGWSRVALEELSVHLVEQRVPLAWAELKAVDNASC